MCEFDTVAVAPAQVPRSIERAGRDEVARWLLALGALDGTADESVIRGDVILERVRGARAPA